MQVAFCLFFKLFITHTAETFYYPRTWVMMWCTHSTLMPRCSLICQSVAEWSHCTIWFTMAPVSGFVTWGGQPGHVRSSVLLICSLNLLHQSDTALCCKRLLPYTCFIKEWKSAGLAPFAHKLEDAVLCVPGQMYESPALSNMLLCRDHTEQPAYEMCILWLIVTTVGWRKNN